MEFTRGSMSSSFISNSSKNTSTNISRSSRSSSSSTISSSSSSTSLPSQSTIKSNAIPQTSIRPFGCPEYNYCLIEDKSNNNSMLSCNYDYKKRYLPQKQQSFNKSSLIPSKCKCISKYCSDSDGDLIVSDDDYSLKTNVKLGINERNVHLIKENNLAQVLSVQKIAKSKKMMDILWKLHRFPGESLKDLKERFSDSLSGNKFDLKSDDISNDELYSEEEVYDNSRMKYFRKTEENLDVNSDSNSDNISCFNKWEHITFENIEPKNKSERGEKSEEIIQGNQNYSKEEKKELKSINRLDKGNDIKYTSFTVKNQHFYKEDYDKYDLDSLPYTYESPCLLADFLYIEINVNEKENVFIPSDNLTENDSEVESIDWKFEKVSERLPNSSYNVPQVKQYPFQQISKINRQCYRNKTRRRKKKVFKSFNKKSTSHSKKRPIVCEMYGTRTVNYNSSLDLQMPKWQSCTNLSDTSEDSDDLEVKNHKIDKESLIFNKKSSVDSMNRGNVSGLKDSFSGKKIRKKTKSISPRCELNLSSTSEENDFNVASLNAREKKSFLPLREKKKTYSGIEDNIAMTLIEREDKAISFLELDEKWKLGESKIIESMTSAGEPVVDLGTVKVEKSITDVEEGSRNASVAVESKENNDDDHSSDSDKNSRSDSDSSSSSRSSSNSSSCTCSRSSCFGVSSSSSSDSSIENDYNSNVTKSKNDDF